MAENPFDKYKNFDKAFLQNVWGKRARGLSLPQIDWSGPIKREDVLYLLNRYPFLQIISTEPAFDTEMEPKFVQANSGWTIHDYGDAMSASPGELLYSDYSQQLKTLEKKEDEDEGEGGKGGRGVIGKGTIINQAFMTAQQMIAIAIEKGWPGVELVDGTELMKWAAWMAAEDNNLTLTGFEPSEADRERRVRIRKFLTEVIEPSAAPKLGY